MNQTSEPFSAILCRKVWVCLWRSKISSLTTGRRNLSTFVWEFLGTETHEIHEWIWAKTCRKRKIRHKTSEFSRRRLRLWWTSAERFLLYSSSSKRGTSLSSTRKVSKFFHLFLLWIRT